MESMNSASGHPEATVETSTNLKQELSDKWLSERFESLLPKIQQEWPDLAKQTLEASRGSLDELIKVISQHSGKNAHGVQEQLEEIFHTASERTKDIAEKFEPLEEQLQDLLDELNTTLRPKIEKRVRAKPLLALGIATGLGVMLGIFMTGGRRSS